MTRREFYSRVGLLHDVDALTTAAYNFIANKEQAESDIGAAAHDPWYVSFHGSQFPGDNPRACGRKAMYRMMDIPRPIAPRWLQQVADAGKDIEDRLVQKWYDSGYLLSKPPYNYKGEKNHQDVFEDASVWLTSTVDAIVLFPNSGAGRVCEVKSKGSDEVHEMFKLYRGPDPAHIFQLKCQIGLAHEAGGWDVKRCYNSGRLAIEIGEREGKVVSVCPEHMHDRCLRDEHIEPPEGGTIYYVSRDWPADTWEFYYDYDPVFMEKGRAKLRDWREWFMRGELPQYNFEDKRFAHPMNWAWTKSKKDPLSPCEWCDYGDICRTDNRTAIKQGKPIKLSESSGVEIAEEIREGFDLTRMRDAVLRRWNVNDTDGD